MGYIVVITFFLKRVMCVLWRMITIFLSKHSIGLISLLFLQNGYREIILLFNQQCLNIFFLKITNCVTNTNTIKAIKETMWQRSSTIFLWRPKIGQYHVETTVFLCERETQWKDSFNTISKTGNLGLFGCTVECAVMQEGRSERCGGGRILSWSR